MNHFFSRWFVRGMVVIAAALALDSARCDMSVLGVTGPHSGTGFSNLGAISKTAVTTVLTNAEVLIEIQGKKGDDLIATCTAVFDLDTDAGPSQAAQTLLVAFPVTGFTDEAVKISQFEVVVDGVRMPELPRRNIRLFSEENGPSPYVKLDSIKANPNGFDTLGYRLNGTDTLMQAYAWTQEFLPGKHCRVGIKYSLTLHPQSLAYAKKVLRGQSRNIVPFDAMWAGESDQKAYFLDYILRSGATWKGPIGHEKVTLRVASTSGITLDLGFDGELVIFGRHVFEYSDAHLRESFERHRAGVDSEGVSRSNGIIWEIDHEEPQQDILVQIPWDAVKSKLGDKAQGR